MHITTRATIDDLYKVEGKAELVNGEIVEMPPSGDEPSSAAFEIATHLKEHARHIGRGRAYPDGVGFHVNLQHARRDWKVALAHRRLVCDGVSLPVHQVCKGQTQK